MYKENYEPLYGFRTEFDKQLQHFDVLEQDYNQLALEKDDLID